MNSDVSVVITNYNGQDILPKTLESVRQLDPMPAEVILVDDGSTDQSVKKAKEILPSLRVVLMGKNTARLNQVRNAGLRAARHKLVFLMDNDILLEPDCVRNLMHEMSRLPHAVVCTPRLLFANEPNRIYTDGAKLHYIGSTILLNRNEVIKGESPIVEGTTGGGILLLDKEKAEEVGFFNETFSMGWCDDGELYLRLILNGHKCYHISHAVGYHFEKLRTTERAYAQVRNRWLVILEDFSIHTLIILAPAFFAYEIFLLSMLIMKGSMWDYWRGNADVFRELSSILQRRRKTQSQRKIRDRVILSSGELYVSPTLLNKSVFRVGIKIVNSFFAGYWHLVKVFI